MAVTAKHRSIAFPAIGTGALGFSNGDAAEIMWNAVWDFAQKCPVPLEVHFVIFPYDDLVFKVESRKCSMHIGLSVILNGKLNYINDRTQSYFCISVIVNGATSGTCL